MECGKESGLSKGYIYIYMFTYLSDTYFHTYPSMFIYLERREGEKEKVIQVSILTLPFIGHRILFEL